MSTTDIPGAPVEKVNHPPHYKKHPSNIECIQITEHMNFCLGNAVKYIWRADHKNGVEDLEKAAWYIRREIERRKSPPSDLSAAFDKDWKAFEAWAMKRLFKDKQ